MERVITIVTLHGAAAVFTEDTEAECTGQCVVCWMLDNVVSARFLFQQESASILFLLHINE